MRDKLRRCRFLAVIALAGLGWSCSTCDAHGVLETEDKIAMSGCTAILHRVGQLDPAIESVPVRAGFEFWYRRKRGTPAGPLQITLVCPGYWAVKTKTFEWHPKVLDEWDCNAVELGTITLPKLPPAQKPAP